MGGGGTMRAAAKVAGLGFVNTAFRGGVSSENSVASAARVAELPVYEMVSPSSVSVAAKDGDLISEVQKPGREIDDWEFAGGEEDLMTGFNEPMPRLVFGGAPSLQEAQEATTDLKDALKGPRSDSQELCLPLISNSRVLETSARAINDSTIPVPKHAMQAFKFLSETPTAQNVVASIASDLNVWNAMLQNDALVGFLQSQKTRSSLTDINVSVMPSVVDPHSQELKSHKSVAESFSSGEFVSMEYAFRNGFVDFVQNVKVTVIDMMNDVSAYFQNIFGAPMAEKASLDGTGSARTVLMDKALGASFMGLVVMVIMVVVLKRG